MEQISLQELLQHLHTLLPKHPLSEDADATVLPRSIAPLPRLSSEVPESPSPSSSSLSQLTTYLQSNILPSLNQSSLSPNYYGFVTGGSTPAATLADWLVTIYDQNVSVHLPKETIATNVEVAALNQLVQLFNLGREWSVGNKGGSSGTFTTGATASNILGLALGREWVLEQATERKLGSGKGMRCSDTGVYECMVAAGLRKVKVLSTLPHSSIGKAASVVGLGRNSIVNVARAEGDGLGIDMGKLRTEVSEEGTASILAISAGEVNTGRFATGGLEMMRAVRKLCDEHSVWIHVDGAFGLFAKILMDQDEVGGYSEIIKGVEGLELADSITGDGHKLLNVPYDCGLFFTRHKGLNENVCSNGNAAYLTSGMSGEGDGIQSPSNMGLENSRRFRALPVHATLLSYGRKGYVDMLKRQIGLARRVVRWLWRDVRYEVLPREASEDEAVRKTYMIVLFRAKDEKLNRILAKSINATGKVYVTGTKWEQETAVRIAVSNWQADIGRDGKLIEEVLNKVASN